MSYVLTDPTATTPPMTWERLSAFMSEVRARPADMTSPPVIVSPRFAHLLRDLAWAGDGWTPRFGTVRPRVVRLEPGEERFIRRYLETFAGRRW